MNYSRLEIAIIFRACNTKVKVLEAWERLRYLERYGQDQIDFMEKISNKRIIVLFLKKR